MDVMTDEKKKFRIAEISLDADLSGRQSPDVEHERRIAIFDLIEENYFRPANSEGGPYFLTLSLVENRLVFDIRVEPTVQFSVIALSLTPFKKIIKDYFFICDSYYKAIKTASPAQIEAIDMGRRGLHNEGSELLRERLDGKVEIDFDTSRRLFTLICALNHGQARG